MADEAKRIMNKFLSWLFPLRPIDGGLTVKQIMLASALRRVK